MKANYRKFHNGSERGGNCSIEGLPVALVAKLEALCPDKPAFVDAVFALLDEYPALAATPPEGSIQLRDDALRLRDLLASTRGGIRAIVDDPIRTAAVFSFYGVDLKQLEQRIASDLEKLSARSPSTVKVGAHFTDWLLSIVEEFELPLKVRPDGRGQWRSTGRYLCQLLQDHEAQIYHESNHAAVEPAVRIRMNDAFMENPDSPEANIVQFPSSWGQVKRLERGSFLPVVWWDRYTRKP